MADPGSQRAAICHYQLRWGGNEKRKQTSRENRNNKQYNKKKKKPKTWGYSFKPADEVLQNWRYMQKSAEKYVREHRKNQTRDTKVKSSSGAI